MIHIPLNEEIAVSATLSMVLEAASYPKPGNVHRLQDYEDTSFEHFLASALSVQSVFLKCASDSAKNSAKNSTEKEKPAFGPHFYETVLKSQSVQSGGNTHFGTFILLLPLAAATGIVFKDFENENRSKKRKEIEKAITQKASEICRTTTADDAIFFYKAFGTLSIPVQKTEKGKNDYELDLNSAAAIEKIRIENIPLFDLMAMGAKRDMVAAEWVNGFEKSKQFSRKLLKNKAWFETHPEKCFGSVINSAVVYTFLEFMAKYPDTFIATKYDNRTALKVQEKAAKMLKKSKKNKNLKKMIPDIQKFDRELRKKKLNPGSLADITAAGIFIALFEGLKI
ncbi:triphosphoribosyl-dephospho-CoA synthase [Methanimicrococcus blatticola]|uniref:Triphosphoribosyl-dephospho-CoA synthase n=1 Tax=Methanimicrococcus blatticola TaxID=91560 RepID=A0A484F548_9EURY|nr:triphosphoribosyl-dephospho-CoA synthase [Methanimicrococcus blatticola]MBZ3936019.1 triphosphoribosyl-dephospho-CoA synthase [Methanimicrococcus blatticola]MCC2509368.1 triphosphoribosyl-dephospho-CoA synthase [Methanimicrococcus blatticola]TDQ68251.1 triphosphoribosyl-dephospho-CoA synthase [Methanimicrococcus blatticola]